MAIIRSLAVGKARKSAGNITYQTVKGRTIAREKPAFVANPNTPLQQAQRTKMRTLVAAWRAWYFMLKAYFTVIDGYGSAYNQFVKMNMERAEEDWLNPNGTAILVKGAYLSNGKYGIGSVDVSGTGNLTVPNIQLRQEAEAGDRIVRIGVGTDTTNPTIEEYTLLQDDIDNIRDGVAVELPFGADEGDQFLFYSSARRTSSVVRVPL